MNHKPKGIYEKFIKRIFDFILSLLALIILSPLLLITIILVRIKLGSPVIFKQERPGKDEQTFKLYKFRTMTNEKDENGELLSDEVRLTKFGKFLRSTSIDELPELVNILKGDMSIIGPRPLLMRYLPYYTIDERERFTVKPGLTGLAQISGRNALSWSKRFATDVEYVGNITFIMDFKIFIKTILKVVKKEDILVGNDHVLQDLDVERGGIKTMNENIEIREFLIEDILKNKDSIIKLINENLNINLGYFESNIKYAEEKYEDVLNFKKDNTAILIGGFDKEDLVGFLWGYKKTFMDEPRAHLAHLIVNNDYRSCGIGKKLENEFERVLIDNGIRKIELITTVSNTGAVNFYKNNGFNVTRIQLEKDLI